MGSPDGADVDEPDADDDADDELPPLDELPQAARPRAKTVPADTASTLFVRFIV